MWPGELTISWFSSNTRAVIHPSNTISLSNITPFNKLKQEVNIIEMGRRSNVWAQPVSVPYRHQISTRNKIQASFPMLAAILIRFPIDQFIDSSLPPPIWSPRICLRPDWTHNSFPRNILHDKHEVHLDHYSPTLVGLCCCRLFHQFVIRRIFRWSFHCKQWCHDHGIHP